MRPLPALVDRLAGALVAGQDGQAGEWRQAKVTAINPAARTFTVDLGFDLDASGWGVPAVDQGVWLVHLGAARWLYMGPSSVDAWRTLTPATGWAASATLRYRLQPTGLVAVTGTLTRAAGAPPDAETVFTLPVGYRADQTVGMVAAVQQTTVGYARADLLVDTAGAAKIYGFPAGGSGTATLYVNVLLATT